jgi:hypothetical protein
MPYTLGEGWGLERAHDRHTTDAELLGHGAIRPPLTVQRPHLCIGGEPPRPALRRPGLGLRRRHTRGDWDGGLAIGLDDGCTAARCAHRLECRPMGAEDLVERFSEVLQEVKTVGHLRGLRRTRTSAIHIRFQAISGDDRDPRMRVQPSGERVSLTVVEQCHWLVMCEVHHDCPIALALLLGPIIDPDGLQRRDDRQGQTAHQPQQSVPTGR